MLVSNEMFSLMCVLRKGMLENLRTNYAKVHIEVAVDLNLRSQLTTYTELPGHAYGYCRKVGWLRADEQFIVDVDDKIQAEVAPEALRTIILNVGHKACNLKFDKNTFDIGCTLGGRNVTITIPYGALLAVDAGGDAVEPLDLTFNPDGQLIVGQNLLVEQLDDAGNPIGTEVPELKSVTDGSNVVSFKPRK